MRIIREGRIPEKVLEEVEVYEQTCTNCGTIFEFSATEIYLYGPDSIMIKCPFCNVTGIIGTASRKDGLGRKIKKLLIGE